MIWLIILSVGMGVLYLNQKMDGLPQGIQWVLAITILLVLFSLMLFFSLLTHICLIWSLLALISFYGVQLWRGRAKIGAMNFRMPSQVGILGLILLGLSVNAYQKHVFPWGGWDAIAIWNQHAKFLTDDRHWTLMFEKSLSSSHPDYPLFLPSLIAFGWSAMDKIHFIVPMLLGVLPLLGIITLLYFSTENRLLGIFASFAILLDSGFIDQAASQYADTWMSFFIILGIHLIIHLRNKSINPVLVGFLLSASSWVKNEGLIFYILAAIAVIFDNRHNRKEIVRFLLGSLPIITTLILFKLIWTPPNDMVAESDLSLINKLMSLERYQLIILFAIKTVKSGFVLIPGMMLVGLVYIKKWSKKVTTSVVLLAVLLSIYFGIYLVTPKDLTWHLETSFYRLMHQAYPSILLCFVLLLEHNLGSPRDHSIS